MVTRPMPKHVRLGFGGFIALILLAVVLLPMAHATIEADPNGYHLLILEDYDPDFKGSDVYGDRLYMMDSQGRLEAAVTGLSIFDSMGGNHRMAVDEARKTLWVTENMGARLWQFNLKTGCLVRQIPEMEASAVAIDPQTGNAWVLISTGLIGESYIKVVSPQGKVVAEHEISGHDISYSLLPHCAAVDTDQDIVWLGCEGAILRFSTEGQKLKTARSCMAYTIVPHPGKKRHAFVGASVDVEDINVKESGYVEFGFLGGKFLKKCHKIFGDDPLKKCPIK